MKVVINNKYSYESGNLKLKVGDSVKLPTPTWLRDCQPATWVGKVTSLKSDYTGYCEEVIAKC